MNLGYTKSMGASQTKSTFSALTEDHLRRFKAGAVHFNEGRFFEAHEDWEIGWNRLPFPDRPQVQAAILVSAVFVLVDKKRWEPAKRLAHLALERFAEAATAVRMHGVEPALQLPGVEDRLIRVLAFLEANPIEGREHDDEAFRLGLGRLRMGLSAQVSAGSN